MHKIFYASGFLFNLSSQQILLQQQKDITAPHWSMIAKKGENDTEDPIHVFRKAISEQLNIELPLESIYPVYNYVDESSQHLCYTFYAEVDIPEIEKYKREGYTMEWFNLKQINKLSIPRQIKHDIIVADRVIKAKARIIEENLQQT